MANLSNPPHITTMASVNSRFPSGDQSFMVDASIVNHYYSVHVPITPLTAEADHLDFIIPPSTGELTDLSDIFLTASVSVRNKDGESPDAEDHYALCNNVLHSLFSSLEIYANGTLIRPRDENFALLSYLQSTFGMNTDMKTSLGPAMGFQEGLCFAKSNIAQLAKPASEDTAKTGLSVPQRAWKTASENGKKLFLCGKLIHDLASLSMFLTNGVSLRFKFTRQRDQYLIVTPAKDKGYRLQLHTCSLHIKRLVPSEGALQALDRVVSHKPINYFFRRMSSKTYAILKGENERYIEDPFSGYIPQTLMLVLVSQTANHGSYEQDPFELKPFGLSKAQLTMDGTVLADWNTRFTEGDFTAAYVFSLSALGPEYFSNGLTMPDFASHKFLLQWDLSPDDQKSSEGGTVSLEQSGVLKLFLKFDAALTETLSLILIGVGQASVSINKERAVSLLSPF